jgi:hypothetical protein
MPANYVLLEKITVGAAGASSVTFSGIPQTGYTDLVVKLTARTTYAELNEAINVYPNGSGSNGTRRALYGTGSAAASESASNIRLDYLSGNTATANTFGTGEIYIPNYTSSNFKSMSMEAVAEGNTTGMFMAMTAGLWSSTSAITSLQLSPLNGTFLQHSTFYLYGVAKLGTTPAIVPYATGGDIIMTDGTYWYHTFLSSGTFTPAKGLTVDYLVVAGGGGGGGGANASDNRAGGGGGAGGFLTSTGFSCASGTGLTVTVGAGGAGGGNSANGTNGSNSVFSSITATGGGYGGRGNVAAGATGGSGGGGGSQLAAGGSGTSGQGNAGGNGYYNGGGGGGGASAAGTTAAARGGAGGNGTASSYSGSSVSYAGGGGGGGMASPRAAGGTGGGGGGATDGTNNAIAGTPNTGGGGGGGVHDGSTLSTSGSGGSGIVLVRYLV